MRKAWTVLGNQPFRSLEEAIQGRPYCFDLTLSGLPLIHVPGYDIAKGKSNSRFAVRRIP